MSAGGGLAVWNAATGSELIRIPGPQAEVAISPDNTGLVAVTGDGTTTAVLDCEVCIDDIDALRSLAATRITRAPTAAEIERYGLD